MVVNQQEEIKDYATVTSHENDVLVVNTCANGKRRRRRRKKTVVDGRSAAVVLLYLTIGMIMMMVVPAYSFRFDHDTDDNCSSQTVQTCTSDPHAFFGCPVTCSKFLAKTGTIGQAKVPEDFYVFEVPLSNGKTMSLEDNDGYVTLIAMVPLVPGMAQYYYEMLEHVQSVYHYTTEILLVPYKVDNDTTTTIKVHEEQQNVKLLKPVSSISENSLLDYLFDVQGFTKYPITAPNFEDGGEKEDVNKRMYTDRVTIFIVSTTGKFVDRFVTPPMWQLEERINVYLKLIESRVEL